jgi:hypothetical protein
MCGCKVQKNGAILPPKLHTYEEFATYLTNRFEIYAIDDDDDRHLVHECNKDDLFSHHNITDTEQWYYEKVMSMH